MSGYGVSRLSDAPDDLGSVWCQNKKRVGITKISICHRDEYYQINQENLCHHDSVTPSLWICLQRNKAEERSQIIAFQMTHHINFLLRLIVLAISYQYESIVKCQVHIKFDRCQSQNLTISNNYQYLILKA